VFQELFQPNNRQGKNPWITSQSDRMGQNYFVESHSQLEQKYSQTMQPSSSSCQSYDNRSCDILQNWRKISFIIPDMIDVKEFKNKAWCEIHTQIQSNRSLTELESKLLIELIRKNNA
jgi:hypothetical protein